MATLLRIATAGSVDDGKSTLIGRLLYDSKLLFDDQLAALKRDAHRGVATRIDIDFASLIDGLEAEQEQGITIDVAYRFFATARRKFIVADAPGHEEYTRNMVTAASTATLAVVLVDSRKGILRQTRRHSFIASLLGVRHIVLAVNKIDLMGYDQRVFETIVADYTAFAQNLGFATVVAIPISARFGDNMTSLSPNMPWYNGVTLLNHLETVAIDDNEREEETPFRFPVQLVMRPNLDFRGFAGQVASGSIDVGDPIVVAKSGQRSKIKEIVTYDGKLGRAVEGQSVTLVLEDELEVSRGNMLVRPEERPHVADQFMAHVIWLHPDPMLPGRSYVLRTEVDSVSATITSLKHQIDVNTFAEEAAKSLGMNEIGVCNLSTQAPIVFDSYKDNRTTGNFVLIDRFTNATVGAGMIDFPLRRALNVHWQALDINKRARSALNQQQPRVLWFTGFSGSGKSTLLRLVIREEPTTSGSVLAGSAAAAAIMVVLISPIVLVLVRARKTDLPAGDTPVTGGLLLAHFSWSSVFLVNVPLAAIALAVVTTVIVKQGNLRWAWIPGVALVWDLLITLWASALKIFSSNPKIGYFAQRDAFVEARDKGELLTGAASPADMDKIIFNSLGQLDRFAEIDHTAGLLTQLAGMTTTGVVLNRDDPFVNRIATTVSGLDIAWFGLDASIADRLGELQEHDSRGGDDWQPPALTARDALLRPVDEQQLSVVFGEQGEGGRVGPVSLRQRGLAAMINATAATATARALLGDGFRTAARRGSRAHDEIVRDHLNEQLLKLWARTNKTICFVTHSIPEAVYLSTKIVVMSPRPGRVTDVIESPLPRERPLGIRETPEFLEIAHRVREGLRAGHSYDE